MPGQVLRTAFFFNRKRKRLGEDFCDVISSQFQDGGSGGDTQFPITPASNVPCFYDLLSKASESVVGGTTYTATHRITMVRTEETSAIKPEDKIRVRARTDKTELIFEHPVVTEQSFITMVVAQATLVQQGFQQ